MKRCYDEICNERCNHCDVQLNNKSVIGSCSDCNTINVTCYSCGTNTRCFTCEKVATSKQQEQDKIYEQHRCRQEKEESAARRTATMTKLNTLKPGELLFKFESDDDISSSDEEETEEGEIKKEDTKEKKRNFQVTDVSVLLNIVGYHALDCDAHVRHDDTLEMDDEIRSVELNLNDPMAYKLELFHDLSKKMTTWLENDSKMMDSKIELMESFEYEADGYASGMWRGKRNVNVYFLDDFTQRTNKQNPEKTLIESDELLWQKIDDDQFVKFCRNYRHPCITVHLSPLKVHGVYDPHRVEQDMDSMCLQVVDNKLVNMPPRLMQVCEKARFLFSFWLHAQCARRLSIFPQPNNFNVWFYWTK